MEVSFPRKLCYHGNRTGAVITIKRPAHHGLQMSFHSPEAAIAYKNLSP